MQFWPSSGLVDLEVVLGRCAASARLGGSWHNAWASKPVEKPVSWWRWLRMPASPLGPAGRALNRSGSGGAQPLGHAAAVGPPSTISARCVEGEPGYLHQDPWRTQDPRGHYDPLRPSMPAAPTAA